MGILVPFIQYAQYAPPGAAAETNGPALVTYRLTDPHMTGSTVKDIQRVLKGKGFEPGSIDGDFGANTHAAVVSFQASRRFVVDGEVGPTTARALGVKLPRA